jgi:hypothetical protein
LTAADAARVTDAAPLAVLLASDESVWIAGEVILAAGCIGETDGSDRVRRDFPPVLYSKVFRSGFRVLWPVEIGD